MNLVVSYEQVQQPLLYDLEAQRVINYSRSTLLMSAGGVIYCSRRDFRHIRLAQQYLLSTGLPSNQVTVVDCTDNVIAIALRILQQPEQLSLHQKIKEDEDDSQEDRSDAQFTLDFLINHGLNCQASDIHLTIEGKLGRVQMRIWGRLVAIPCMYTGGSHWQIDQLEKVCSVAVNNEAARVNGATDHFNTEKPLDASFLVKVDGQMRKIRYAQTPTAVGYKVVMRILAEGNDATQQTVMDLGYLPYQALLIEEAAQMGAGLAIVAGPTGSGKTTTLGILLSQVPEEMAVYSYEDPVEFILPRVAQVPVKPTEGRDWSSLSKNSLRLDPDTIMYGELRTAEVAAEIVHAATTGHMVFTTLHSNSAVGCVTRLQDLGLAPHRLAEPGLLKWFVFQRLIPKTCPHCALCYGKFVPTSKAQKRQWKRLESSFPEHLDKLRLANTGGQNQCQQCTGSGVVGRLLVAEIILIDQPARQFILDQDMSGWIQCLQNRGWKSVLDHARLHVEAGEACPLLAENTLSESFSTISDGLEGFDYAGFEQEVQGYVV